MKPRQHALIAGAATVAAATLLLLLPAFVNGFPLVFPDTGAYLSVAWTRSWTLDRAGFYGFAFRSLSGLPAVWQLWIGVALQCAAVAFVLLMAIRVMAPRLSPAQHLAIVAAMALLTSLPWHSAQLMPDALTGICVLLAWLAVSRDPAASGTPSLWLATVIAGIMHFTHLILVPVTAAVALLAQALGGVGRREIAKRAVAAAAATAAILVSHVAANGFMLHRWTLDPVGSTFLFARLNEDGLIAPWMRNHCQEVPELCRIYPALPKDSQQLLWGERSPFVPLIWDRLDSHTEGPILSELSRASIGAIAEHPLMFGRTAAEATFDQLTHFAPLDDECPAVCTSPSSAVYDLFQRERPGLMQPFRHSAQAQGTLPKFAIAAVTIPIAAFSMAALVGLAFVIRRRNDVIAESLIWAVLAALLVNAAAAGVLSDVHDRYQSRIVWLAPLAVVLCALRLYDRNAQRPIQTFTSRGRLTD